MSECKYCGVNITWIDRIPYEDGIDHREICQGVNMSPEQAKTAAHERRVRAFLSSEQKRRRR